VSMCGQSHPNREGVKMLFFSSGKSTTGHVLGAWSPVWRCVVEHQRKLSFSLFLSYASSRVNSFAPPCVPYPDMFPYYDPHPQKMGPNNHRLNPPKLLAKWPFSLQKLIISGVHCTDGMLANTKRKEDSRTFQNWGPWGLCQPVYVHYKNLQGISLESPPLYKLWWKPSHRSYAVRICRDASPIPAALWSKGMLWHVPTLVTLMRSMCSFQGLKDAHISTVPLWVPVLTCHVTVSVLFFLPSTCLLTSLLPSPTTSQHFCFLSPHFLASHFTFLLCKELCVLLTFPSSRSGIWSVSWCKTSYSLP
jgi:hypothetical protein